ncbi:GNAT family N-acetyltransferase [Amphritea sp. 2_MG-2023]|uniref:tRNA(Met) cytidine acetyltransferase TmcA n=1 Tax=Amphritea TaxID=515417 RepID=UPI001C069E35|nr:GNAT family N-acetyltransferase [Amphritea sp. 2_MG-2023]MBU2964205.1 GNAT family N-acetyltransferase [Amphritea atlantica]MDO6419538.1 GNAT family N-acetyltransferase [Amphritea sp. 2_MG-2023]
MASGKSVLNNLTRGLEDAQRRSHRLLVVLSGSQAWCQAQLDGFTYLGSSFGERAGNEAQWLWIGDAQSGLTSPIALPPISAKQAHQLLGQECQGIIYDAWSGFNPNGFGQVVGTLVAGGVFILITPAADAWQDYSDPEYRHIAVPPFTAADVGRRFIQHLQKTIAADTGLIHFCEGELNANPLIFEGEHGVHCVADINHQQDLSSIAVPAPFKTKDQQDTVQHCVNILSQLQAVTVITADRGRGKSAALGILVARLMQKHQKSNAAATNPLLEILLTAPSRGAIQAVVTLLQRLLPADELTYERDCWHYGESRLRFLLPDQLLQQKPEADLLLVDEAAAIPAPLLLSLLDYPRVIFASTLHGYEGTGQGFSVRFLPYLDRRVPQRKLLRMHQPVRWAEGDPLERFSYQALLLDAEPADLSDYVAERDDVCYRKLDRDELVADTRRLKQLFGLLMLAHYRTTPGDLRILLDSPNIEIWGASVEHKGETQLVAAVLLAYEGPIDTDLAEAIMKGTRRPKGQLIPQTLLAHCQIADAAHCRGLRVMRIAVHPQLQRQGIGSALLQAVEQGSQDIDWLGTSFGATSALCCFWQRFGLQLQRLGHSRDKVSGTYAAVMLRGISPAGVALQRQGRVKATEQRQQMSASQRALIGTDLLALFDYQPSSGALG